MSISLQTDNTRLYDTLFSVQDQEKSQNNNIDEFDPLASSQIVSDSATYSPQNNRSSAPQSDVTDSSLVSQSSQRSKPSIRDMAALFVTVPDGVTQWAQANNFSPDIVTILSKYTYIELLSFSKQRLLNLCGPRPGVLVNTRLRQIAKYVSIDHDTDTFKPEYVDYSDNTPQINKNKKMYNDDNKTNYNNNDDDNSINNNTNSIISSHNTNASILPRQIASPYNDHNALQTSSSYVSSYHNDNTISDISQSSHYDDDNNTLQQSSFSLNSIEDEYNDIESGKPIYGPSSSKLSSQQHDIDDINTTNNQNNISNTFFPAGIGSMTTSTYNNVTNATTYAMGGVSEWMTSHKDLLTPQGFIVGVSSGLQYIVYSWMDAYKQYMEYTPKNAYFEVGKQLKQKQHKQQNKKDKRTKGSKCDKYNNNDINININHNINDDDIYESKEEEYNNHNNKQYNNKNTGTLLYTIPDTDDNTTSLPSHNDIPCDVPLCTTGGKRYQCENPNCNIVLCLEHIQKDLLTSVLYCPSCYNTEATFNSTYNATIGSCNIQ